MVSSSPFDVIKKYNLKPSIFGYSDVTEGLSDPSFGNSGLGNSLALNQDNLMNGSDAESTSQLLNQIGNYQRRISAIDEPVEKPADNTNVFLKVLSLLDRPRAALWNGLHNAFTGKNLWEGIANGFTGKENYTGADLMRDLGVKNKTLQGVLGFGAELVGDPLNAVTLGAGDVAKGALTGTTRALSTADEAGALAKTALKDITTEGAETAARNSMRDDLAKLGQNVDEMKPTNPIIQNAVKENIYNSTNDTLQKTVGKALNPMEAYASTDDVMKHAQELMKQGMLDNSARKAGRGLSIGTRNHNITLLSGDAMRNVGAGVSNFVKNNVPVIGSAVDKLQDFGSKIFNPKFVNGLDDASQNVVYKLRRDAYGEKNLADKQLMGKFDTFTKTLGSLGVKSAKEQDELLGKLLEGEVKDTDVDQNILKLVNGWDESGTHISGIKEDLANWLKEEQKAGMNITERESYMPHVLNWTGEKANAKGGMTEKLKMFMPSGLARKYQGSVEKVNNLVRFRTSSPEAQAEYLKQVWGLAGKDAPDKIPSSDEFLKFLADHNIDMDKVNEISRDTLNGTPDFLETSLTKAWVTRGLSHNKVIADKSFLDNVLAAFGTKVDNEKAIKMAIDNGQDIIVPKSSLRAYAINTGDSIKLNKGIKDVGKAAAEQGVGVAKGADDIETSLKLLSPEASSVVKRLIDNTPEAFVKISPDDYKILSNEGSALFAKQNAVEAYAVPHGVVGAVNGAATKQIEAGTQALGAALDKFYSIWKPTVTGLNPSYHIRNLVGGTLNNILDVGFKALRPDIQKASLEVAREGAQGSVKLAGQDISIKEIRDAMTRTHANTDLQISDFTNHQASMQSRYAKNVGEGKGGILGGAVNTVKDQGVIKSIGKPGELVGKKIETDVRANNFMANVEKGLEQGMTKDQAFDFAGEQVNKFQFDYSELTPTEKNVFRRVAPFYSWMRKNLPLQLENFLNNPAFYTAIPKYQRNMEQALGIDASQMPEWFSSQMPLPITKDTNGNSQFANISAPEADISNMISDPLQYLINALSPVIKVPIETATNRSLLTGAPLAKNDYEKTSAVLNNILNQFGVFRDAKNAMTQPDTSNTKAVSSAPLIMKTYNPTEALKDSLYNYNLQLGNQVQHLQDTTGGLVPNTYDVDQWNKLPPEVKAVAKKYGILPPGFKPTQMITVPVSQGDSPRLDEDYGAQLRSKILSKYETFDKIVNKVYSTRNGGL